MPNIKGCIAMKESSNSSSPIITAAIILAVMFGGILLYANVANDMSSSASNNIVNKSFSGTRTETETQAIPFEAQTVDDNTIEYGQTVVRTAGVKGEKTLKYEVTYENDKVVSKELKSEEITIQPITKIIARGTKVVWRCVDATSYDKNPYNDNYCRSSTGEALYVPDSRARALDPTYSPGQSGHSYYNSF